MEGEASVEGGLVDRINGLEGVRADIVMLRTHVRGPAAIIVELAEKIT